MGNKQSEEAEVLPGIVTVVPKEQPPSPQPHPLQQKLDSLVVDKPLLGNSQLLGLDEEIPAALWNGLKEALEHRAGVLSARQSDLRGKIKEVEKISEATLSPAQLTSLVLVKRMIEASSLLADFNRLKCDLISAQSEVDQLSAKTLELDWILSGRMITGDTGLNKTE
jgi:hypothetical protein